MYTIIAAIIAHIASLDSHLFLSSKVGGILSSHWSWKLNYYIIWYHKVWVYCLFDILVFFVKACGELLIEYGLADICVTGYSFLDQLRNFYTKLHELFCKCISWTNSVNSGKSMDNYWISCQVMADMKKVYDNH